MAFGRSASLGTSQRASARPLSEINVTPLVDVMLVLLVIFIITAPLLASSIRLDLPRSEAGQPNDQPRFVSLVVDAQQRVYLDDQPVDTDTLAARLAQAAAQHPDTELQLRADRSVPYGQVVMLMGLANQAGLSRIGFVTEAPVPAPSPDPARPAPR